ncbi:MAG: hypothetical protein AB7F78_17590 [Hyphomicrobiaceae bacterium]
MAADGGDDAARTIAEAFAKGGRSELPAGAVRTIVPAERPTPADEQRLIDEIDMLERARAEADARREALVKQREAAEKQDAAAPAGKDPDAGRRAAEAARRVAEERQLAAEAQRLAEAQRKAEEAKRIAEERRRTEEAQRLAEERRKAEEAQRIAEARRQAEEAQRVAEERRLAEARRLAEEAQKAAEARKEAAEKAELARMEKEREAEADRIAAVLRQAREARAQRPHVETLPWSPPPVPTARDERAPIATSTSAQTDPRDGYVERSSAYGHGGGDLSRALPDRHATRVTVLLVMEPGNRGIRRHNKTADPILCIEEGCHVSEGTATPAQLLPHRRAFGAGRTLGERAGACSNALGCVFRGVDLRTYPAVVQPVDMRLLRHDRRQPQVLHEASDCRLDGGRLACSAIEGPDYVMWIVPESMAEAAGPAALEAAVDAGLSVSAETVGYSR